MSGFGARFLKRNPNKGPPWLELTTEQAVLKAAQIMRDHKRPDRLPAQREFSGTASRKRIRANATPLEGVNVQTQPSAPIVENPIGVHDNDVLSGRGALVRMHRSLAVFFIPRSALHSAAFTFAFHGLSFLNHYTYEYVGQCSQRQSATATAGHGEKGAI